MALLGLLVITWKNAEGSAILSAAPGDGDTATFDKDATITTGVPAALGGLTITGGAVNITFADAKTTVATLSMTGGTLDVTSKPLEATNYHMTANAGAKLTGGANALELTSGTITIDATGSNTVAAIKASGITMSKAADGNLTITDGDLDLSDQADAKKLTIGDVEITLSDSTGVITATGGSITLPATVTVTNDGITSTAAPTVAISQGTALKGKASGGTTFNSILTLAAGNTLTAGENATLTSSGTDLAMGGTWTSDGELTIADAGIAINGKALTLIGGSVTGGKITVAAEDTLTLGKGEDAAPTVSGTTIENAGTVDIASATTAQSLSITAADKSTLKLTSANLPTIALTLPEDGNVSLDVAGNGSWSTSSTITGAGTLTLTSTADAPAAFNATLAMPESSALVVYDSKVVGNATNITLAGTAKFVPYVPVEIGTLTFSDVDDTSVLDLTKIDFTASDLGTIVTADTVEAPKGFYLDIDSEALSEIDGIFTVLSGFASDYDAELISYDASALTVTLEEGKLMVRAGSAEEEPPVPGVPSFKAAITTDPADIGDELAIDIAEKADATYTWHIDGWLVTLDNETTPADPEKVKSTAWLLSGVTEEGTVLEPKTGTEASFDVIVSEDLMAPATYTLTVSAVINTLSGDEEADCDAEYKVCTITVTKSAAVKAEPEAISDEDLGGSGKAEPTPVEADPSTGAPAYTEIKVNEGQTVEQLKVRFNWADKDGNPLTGQDLADSLAQAYPGGVAAYLFMGPKGLADRNNSIALTDGNVDIDFTKALGAPIGANTPAEFALRIFGKGAETSENSIKSLAADVESGSDGLGDELTSARVSFNGGMIYGAFDKDEYTAGAGEDINAQITWTKQFAPYKMAVDSIDITSAPESVFTCEIGESEENASVTAVTLNFENAGDYTVTAVVDATNAGTGDYATTAKVTITGNGSGEEPPEEPVIPGGSGSGGGGCTAGFAALALVAIAPIFLRKR